jgi:hypothetical protein
MIERLGGKNGWRRKQRGDEKETAHLLLLSKGICGKPIPSASEMPLFFLLPVACANRDAVGTNLVANDVRFRRVRRVYGNGTKHLCGHILFMPWWG